MTKVKRLINKDRISEFDDFFPKKHIFGNLVIRNQCGRSCFTIQISCRDSSDFSVEKHRLRFRGIQHYISYCIGSTFEFQSLSLFSFCLILFFFLFDASFLLHTCIDRCRRSKSGKRRNFILLKHSG